MYYAPSTAGASDSDTSSHAPPQKIAGALIHTSWSGGSFNVITGVGLNLSNAQPTTCVNAVLHEAWSRYHTGCGQGDLHASGVLSRGGAAPASHPDECPQISQEVALAHIMNRLDEYFQVSEGAHGLVD